MDFAKYWFVFRVGKRKIMTEYELLEYNQISNGQK